MKNNNKKGIERLQKLATHLFSDALYNQPYSLPNDPFMVKKENGIYHYDEKYFGYVCCELPFVFPEDWIETNDGRLFWLLDEEQNLVSSLTSFFQLPESGIKHFLIPGRQNLERYAGRILHNGSTHFDIALNIYELACRLERKSVIHDNPIFYN